MSVQEVNDYAVSRFGIDPGRSDDAEGRSEIFRLVTLQRPLTTGTAAASEVKDLTDIWTEDRLAQAQDHVHTHSNEHTRAHTFFRTIPRPHKHSLKHTTQVVSQTFSRLRDSPPEV